MATRVVEWKKPYTWGKAIEITDEKVINLRLREENNLIIYDEWDDEIYVDLQLPDEIQPIDAFPVWVTTGRVIVDNWWDLQGTIICAKTTSGDNIKLLYADEWTLWMDNWTWTFKQIYFKADVDLITGRLQAQIDTLYALWKFLSLWDCVDGEPMSFPLDTPYEYSTWDWFMIWNVSSATPAVNYRPAWDEWVEDDPSTKEQETEVVETWDVYIYDGTVWLLQKNKLPSWTGDVIWPASATDWNLAVFDGATWKIIKDWGPVPIWFEPDTQWTTGDVLTKTANWYEWSAPTWWWSDIEYVTQAEYNALLPWAESDGKHYFIFTGTPVTWVTLNESSINLTTVWDTYQLTATVSPADAYDKSVNWSSSDTSVATVSTTWLVTCVTPWTCTITVTTTDWWFTATCEVDAWIPANWLLAYYPLISDANDHKADIWASGTTYNWTWIWTSGYTTVGGRTSANFTNGSNRIDTWVVIGNTPLTLCVWAYCTSISDWFCIIGNPLNDHNDWYAMRAVNSIDNPYNYVVDNWTSTDIYLWDNTLAINTWQCIVLTIDTNETKFYIDWNLISTSSTWWNASNYGNFYIASFGWQTQHWWTGNIWEVAIYNRILSASEVSNYYTATA